MTSTNQNVALNETISAEAKRDYAQSQMLIKWAVIAVEGIPPTVSAAVLNYSGFFLPITPIIAVSLLAWLISMHPATKAHASMFKHIAKMQKQKQAAEIKLQTARTAVQLQGIDAKRQEEGAKLKEKEIRTTASWRY